MQANDEPAQARRERTDVKRHRGDTDKRKDVLSRSFRKECRSGGREQ